MSIIGFLLLFAFLILLTMAVFDAIWGTILIINGLVWHTIGFTLHALAFVVRIAEKLFGLGKKPQQRVSVASALQRAYGA
jgi:hypothetical protein